MEASQGYWVSQFPKTDPTGHHCIHFISTYVTKEERKKREREPERKEEGC